MKHQLEKITKVRKKPFGLREIFFLCMVYFLCRLFFQQLSYMKLGFIYPTGVIVEWFYGMGEYINGEWLFGINQTQFVLGESCSGTTFFSLLIAYIALHISTHQTALIWLVLAFPITILANSMRVLSSIYAHNISTLLNIEMYRDEIHVVAGAIAFLSSLLIIAFLIEKPQMR